MLKTIDICEVPVSSVNIQQACAVIDQWIRERKKTYVCVAPVSTIVDSQANHEYKKILEGAGMITPDGMPVVWAAKFKGDKNIARTYGPDLMLALCSEGQNKNYKHYLYGGTNSTCSLLKNVLKDKFPAIQITGEYAPPYRASNEQEDDRIIKQINDANPDVLWVGLGSPKQDYWMVQHRERLNVPVMIGVGAAFDFLAGTKKQSPRWMRQSGLEWLFRLCCEPRRLWRRYLVGNPKFIYLVIKSFFKRKTVESTL